MFCAVSAKELSADCAQGEVDKGNRTAAVCCVRQGGVRQTRGGQCSYWGARGQVSSHNLVVREGGERKSGSRFEKEGIF
jgi:hypothetical protein